MERAGLAVVPLATSESLTGLASAALTIDLCKEGLEMVSDLPGKMGTQTGLYRGGAPECCTFCSK